MGAKRQIVVWEHKHNKRSGKTNTISRIWGCFRTQKKKTLSELKLVQDQDQDLGMFWEHKQKYWSGNKDQNHMVGGHKHRYQCMGLFWEHKHKVGLGIKIRSGTQRQISGSGAVLEHRPQ